MIFEAQEPTLSGPHEQIIEMRDFPVGGWWPARGRNGRYLKVESVRHGGFMTVLRLEDDTTRSLPSDLRVLMEPPRWWERSK